jgi:signal transduction histidine kinase
LTNVARHAACDRADVTLSIDGHALVIDVTDTGRSAEPWVAGVGVSSMSERAQYVGGSCSARGTPDGGRVHAELPYVSTS